MNNLIISIIFVIVVFSITFLINYFRVKKAVTKLSYGEFRKDLRKVQLIDVREKEDFEYAHINGARNIPLSQLTFKASSLIKGIPIYLCDKNGTVSPRAAITLKKKGFDKIFMLDGGLQNWKENLKSKK